MFSPGIKKPAEAGLVKVRRHFNMGDLQNGQVFAAGKISSAHSGHGMR